MIEPPRSRQKGFLLIAVVVVLAVLAAMALMLSTSTSSDVALLDDHAEGATLDYLAESGMQHARWLLSRSGACTGYVDLPSTPFGAGSYSAAVSPTSGSPVSVTAVGTLPDGTSRTLTRDGIEVYDLTVPVTLVLQPGEEGQDAFIEGEIGHRNHNKGDDDELRIGSEFGREYRALLKFDLSSLPRTARVQSARVELELHAFGSNHVVSAHRLLRDWTESSVTWASYDGVGAWNTPGGDFDSDVAGSFQADGVGPKILDITALTSAWVTGEAPNHGLILVAAPGAEANRYYSSDEPDEPRPRLAVTYFCECGTVCTGVPAGNTIILSTDSPATLGGLSFTDRDLAEYDPVTDAATLRLEGALTTLSREVDAVHVFDDGRIVLSTKEDSTLGGLSFEDADLVEYDPTTDTATMYFDGSAHFSDANEDISAVHILNNGNLVLSTDATASLGGLTFSSRDLVEYNPSTSSASIFFDADATSLSRSITALHVLENGRLVLGASGDTTLGGLTFSAADLVEYDPTSDTATLYFSGNAAFDDPDEWIMSAHIGGDGGPGVAVAGDYLDEFNAIAYSGDDGSFSWGNDWQELGETGGPGGGVVRVVGTSSACASGGCLRIGGDEVSMTGRGVSRGADLAGATSATLTFTVADSGSEASVRVEVSGDGGASWTTLQTYNIGSAIASTPTPQSFDISSFATGDTQIRFIGAGSPDDAAYLYIDNVRIDFSGGTAGGGGGAGDGGGDGEPPGPGGAGDYLDEFNAIAYSGDDGSVSWGNDWQELGETGGPGGGVVRVVGASSACASGGCLSIGGDEVSLSGRGVSRGADLAGATSAALTFTVADSGSGASVRAEVSGDAGATWTTLQTYNIGSAIASTPTPQSFDISSFATADTQVRFIGVGSPDDAAYLYIDNVRIDFSGGTTGAPGYTETYSEWTASQSAQWQIMDLGALGVPPGAVVEVAVMNRRVDAQRWAGVRAAGSSLDRRLELHEAESGGVDAVVLHVQANGSAQIEHYADSSADIVFAVLGYWEGAVYVERFDAFSAATSGSWHARNLGGYGVGAGQVAEIVIANRQTASKRKGGVRERGSSVGDRFVEFHEAESGGIEALTMLAKADNTSNAAVEVYAEASADFTFYLMGYWATPPGAFTEWNGSEFDPSSPSGVWADWDLGNEGVPAGSVAHVAILNGEETVENRLGVRGKGTANDRWITLQESENGGYDAASLHAQVDANATIEFFDEDAQRNHRFRVLGWWVLP